VFIHTALVSILSIAFVPLVLLVISTGRLARAINYDFISVPGHVFSRADSWLSLLLSVALALLVSFVARYVQITYRPSVMDRLRDMYFHK
jgi:magnesium-transporting ATPase (P-type)